MSTVLSAKKKTGRPRVDSEAVNVRMERELLAALDAYTAAQPEPLTRPEGIRMIVRNALKI